MVIIQLRQCKTVSACACALHGFHCFQYKLDKSAINDDIQKQVSAYGRLMSAK